MTTQLELGPGSVVEGRYEIVSLLGEGGFAAVYESFDRSIERTVALKILDVGLVPNDQETRHRLLSRFRREAQVAARVDHPGVVGIYDYGFIGEQVEHPFIVMERLEGWDLEEQIFERGPLSPDKAIPLFLGALEALGEAHEHGIVHKDLKPGNIYYANPGEPHESLRILDFGVAFMENAAEGRLTKTGEILGTPNYLAPEYINEQIAKPALDVYQMALILLELLSGRRIVDGSTAMRCFYTHIAGELEVPKMLMESELGPILVSGLSEDHERRFATGNAFAKALRTVDPAEIPSVPQGDIPMVRPVVAATQQHGPETQELEGRERQDSGQTRLGLGEVEEFDTGRFLTEARRTGALSAKQTSRLIELDEVFSERENEALAGGSTRDKTPISQRGTREPRPQSEAAGSEPRIDAGQGEPSGPAGGLESRAPSMWEFTGEAFQDDEAFQDEGGQVRPEAEAEIYDPGVSNRTIVIIALGLLVVVGAASFAAYLILQKQTSSLESPDPQTEKSAPEALEAAEEDDDSVDQAEDRANSDATAASKNVASHAQALAAAVETPEPPEQDDDDPAATKPDEESSAESSSGSQEADRPVRRQPRASKSLWVRVESSPAGAIVTTDGKLVGMTPCKVKFEPEEKSQRVKFDKDGYEPAYVQLNRDDYPSRSVSLEQKAAAPAREADESGDDEDGSDSESAEEPGLRLAP